MKKYSGFVCSLLFGALLWLGQPATAAAQDINSIGGQWKPASGTLHGQNVPVNALNSMSLTITGTSFNASSGGLNSAGTINVTPGKTDEATFLISSGADVNRTLYAKWQLAGNRLTVVFSEQAPPVDFNSTAANKYLVMVYDKGAAGTAAAGLPGAGTTTFGGANGGTGGGAGIE